MVIREQRYARRIAMTPQERDAFLRQQRTCRVATVGPDGTPHVTPLWYLWHEEHLWLYSLVRSKRWTNLQANPRVAVVVDAGDDYRELRGVELVGRAEPIGERPRRGDPHPLLEPVERAFAEKYGQGGGMVYDGRHAWLRVVCERQFTWDFRKLAAL